MFAGSSLIVAAVGQYSWQKVCGVRQAGADSAITDVLHRRLRLSNLILERFGEGIYAMAFPRERTPGERRHVSTLCAKTVVFLGLVDDIIDRAELHVGDKFGFVAKIEAAFFHGKDFNCATPEEHAARYLALKLHATFQEYRIRADLRHTFRALVNITRAQYTDSTEPLVLHRIAKAAGRTYGEIFARVVEVAAATSLPHCVNAAGAIGECLQILDNGSDIETDLAEGILTYATLQIQAQGDSAELRKKLHEFHQDQAAQTLANGKAYLAATAPHAIPAYCALQNLIRFPYTLKNLALNAVRSISTIVGREREATYTQLLERLI
jgi:hypothetical protein